MQPWIRSVLASYFLLGCCIISGQRVGINETGNAPDASALLDLQSTSKGLLIPWMTTAELHGDHLTNRILSILNRKSLMNRIAGSLALKPGSCPWKTDCSHH